MCGIIGFTGGREAAPVLLEGLKALEYRGYDSAGLAVMGEAGLELAKTGGRIEALCEKTHGGADLPGYSGIGHTRWATHGAPTDLNAHPHVSNNGKFAVVHNGIIENYSALREELTARGCVFLSETDTEVVVHLLETCYTGDVKQALMRTAARLEGSYALGILCTDAPGKLYALREASPLILGLGAGENYFASDVTALVAHTRSAVFLEDGQFAELTAEGVTVFDGAGRPIDAPVTRIEWSVEAAEKGGYEHFMLKEIMEQPRAVRAALEPRLRGGGIEFEELGISDEALRNVRSVVITACGSAYYAGCVGRHAIERLCRLPVTTELASELRYSDPLIGPETLVIALSQSGETADTLAAARECKARGARLLAIVNVVGSSLAKLADDLIYTRAGPEIAVASTKGYTTQVAVICALAAHLAHRLGRIGGAELRRLAGRLYLIPDAIQRAIDMNSALPALAKRYCLGDALYYIGRNVDYAVALEAALKMKEISYDHSEAYAAGELKHGTIALISDGTPVVALCCREELLGKMISGIEEVKARGAKVLAVARAGERRILAAADDVIYVPGTEPLFDAIAEIVPLQLLAYYAAREKGCDIDKPRNLAKSVTVE